MTSVPPPRRLPGRLWLVLVAIVIVAVAAGASARWARPASPPVSAPASPSATAPAPSPSPQERLPDPVPPPPDLPVIDYGPAPTGFPADPDPLSLVRLGEGLHPTAKVALYDAPGGRPLAFLAPFISGVPVTTPIVQRRAQWTAILVPSANRTIAWVPPGNWTAVVLRDQIVVHRSTHQLVWLRDDVVMQTWSVSLGTAATPTPLGRTSVLGRSTLIGSVYAGTDVFALNSVPDDPQAVPAGLRGAHIGIHTWYHDGELGKNTTDGCIRLTKSGQQRLLKEIAPGTEVVVID